MIKQCDLGEPINIEPIACYEPPRDYVKWKALLHVRFTREMCEETGKNRITKTHIIKWASNDNIRYKQVKNALNEVIFYYGVESIKDGDIINIEKYKSGSIECYMQDNDWGRLYSATNKKD